MLAKAVGGGARADNVQTVTTTYTTVASDGTVVGDATAAAFTITLLDPSTLGAGKRVYLKKTDNTMNAITLAPDNSKKIDGFASKKLERPRDWIVLESDGTNYIIVSEIGDRVGDSKRNINGVVADGWLEEDASEFSMTLYEALDSYLTASGKCMYGMNAGTTCTFTNGTDTVNATGNGLLNGDIIRFSNSGGALPTGLSATVKYFIVNKTTNDFQVSLTLGGAAVDFTSDGSGTNKFHNKFKLRDTRGTFERGWAHGSANDPDRASRSDRGDGTTGDYVGTKQADELKAHTHPLYNYTTSGSAPRGSGINDAEGASVSGSTGGNESRPINIAAMFIVKF